MVVAFSLDISKLSSVLCFCNDYLCLQDFQESPSRRQAAYPDLGLVYPRWDSSSARLLVPLWPKMTLLFTNVGSLLTFPPPQTSYSLRHGLWAQYPYTHTRYNLNIYIYIYVIIIIFNCTVWTWLCTISFLTEDLNNAIKQSSPWVLDSFH